MLFFLVLFTAVIFLVILFLANVAADAMNNGYGEGGCSSMVIMFVLAFALIFAWSLYLGNM